MELTLEEAKEERAAPAPEEKASDKEERAFANYILGKETRTGEQNMTMGNNGAIIPSTIASRIIKAVRDRCPILERATRAEPWTHRPLSFSAHPA